MKVIREGRRLRLLERHGEGKARNAELLRRCSVACRVHSEGLGVHGGQRSSLRCSGVRCRRDEEGGTITGNAMSGMLKGEEALFKRSPDCVEGATFVVTQMNIFEAKDVSLRRTRPG